MNHRPILRALSPLLILILVLLPVACLPQAPNADEAAEPEPEAQADQSADTRADVTLMLDWLPNTNHTGLFVAGAKGYYEEAGLNVQIVQPGEVYAEQAVAAGAAQFGISFQEALTLARAEEEAPLVSLAAILQHNSSGFAARSADEIGSPIAYAGKRYGSFESPFERPTLEALMRCDGADDAAIQSLEFVSTGFSDPLALLEQEQIDLAWIFYGWQGIQAQQQGLDLSLEMLEDQQACIPDYYTPILITSESLIAEEPQLATALVQAVARGYQDAIDDPAEAAAILLESEPELDPALVEESQAWISPRYQADAGRWGEQSEAVWQDYGDWLLEQGVLEEPFVAGAAFTNAFLPAD